MNKTKVNDLISSYIYANMRLKDSGGVLLVQISESDYEEFYNKLKNLINDDEFEDIYEIDKESAYATYDPDYWEEDYDMISYGTSYFADFADSGNDSARQELIDLIGDDRFTINNLEDSDIEDDFRKALRSKNLIFIDTSVFDNILEED